MHKIRIKVLYQITKTKSKVDSLSTRLIAAILVERCKHMVCSVP